MFKRARPVRAPRRGRRLQAALDSGNRRIRADLDTDAVMRAAVDVLHETLGCRRSSAWLTKGGEPRFACALGELANNHDVRPPLPVVDAAARGRRSLNQLVGGLAVPVFAPGTGLVGVLYLERTELPGIEGWVAEELVFAEAIAHETGLALQAANLYERAVAEKVKSEAILARVADAVVVTDAGGTILQWNQAAERIFSREQRLAVGRGCGGTLGLRRDDENLRCSDGCPLLASAGSAGELGTEVSRTLDDGRVQPLLASAQAVNDPDGAVSEVVHSFRDVTRLKEADEAKALFLATASHELKTPLTVIQGFAQTLLNQHAPVEMQQEALRLIERRAIELDGIVNRLLLSSRVEAGGPDLDLEPTDLEPILSERVEAFAGATERTIRLRVDGPLPAATADASAIAIVVDHLIDNAMKYSPADGPVVVEAAGSDRVEIRIIDRGIGMDTEQLGRCFDKFWQAESSSTRRFKGTGIGLFIVRSLVEAMHGTVRVESMPGRGSTFIVSLRPVGAPAQQRKPHPAIQRSAPGVGEKSVIREFMRQIGVPVRRET